MVEHIKVARGTTVCTANSPPRSAWCLVIHRTAEISNHLAVCASSCYKLYIIWLTGTGIPNNKQPWRWKFSPFTRQISISYQSIQIAWIRAQVLFKTSCFPAIVDWIKNASHEPYGPYLWWQVSWGVPWASAATLIICLCHGLTNQKPNHYKK